MKIILALLIFSLIVMFHELGHFLLAKKNGIAVTEFSLGMGPRLLSHVWGETRYSIKLLPFGGSCLMVGEDEDSDDVNAFNNKSVGARIAVVAAGPVFNFILAFILSLFIVGSIGYDAPVVWKASDGFPAQEAGIEAGDTILRLNHTNIHVYREVSLFVQLNQKNKDAPVDVTYRDADTGETKTVTLIPKQAENGNYYLGFTGSGIRTRGGVFTTLKYSAYEVKYWISTTLKSLGMLFDGQVGANEVSGPEYCHFAVSQFGCYESAAHPGAGRRPSGLSHHRGHSGKGYRSGKRRLRSHDRYGGTDGVDGVCHVQRYSTDFLVIHH